MLHFSSTSRPGAPLARFAPMAWLLSREDLRFFEDHPAIAVRFRRSRYRIFLSYLRELDGEIAAYNRESFRLISLGAWDLLGHFCRRRAILLYHHARLAQAALYYRWLPGRPDVIPMVRTSLDAIVHTVTA